MKIKVLHAAKLYAPAGGGMETVLRDLCDGTAHAWEVSVVAAHEQPATVRERCGEVDVVRAAAYGQAASVPLCPTLPIELWRREADCVVLHEPNPIAGTSLFLHTPAPRLVVWHHSDLVRPWWAPPTYGRLQRALYRRADCVIASSPALAEASPQIRAARRVAIIPFGVELRRYTTTDAATDARVAAIRARLRGPRVLFVGRLVYYKGVHVLLQAIARTRASLILVGDGPLEPSLRDTVASLGIADRIVFAGHVTDDDLRAYYRASDLFVLPSIARTEAFGVVQIEAMASGLPVVSTNLPTGVPWVNKDGDSGLVVEPDDVHALAQAIRRVTEDVALRQRLASGALRRAQTMFARERMVGAFQTLIETVVRTPERLDEALREALA